MIRYLLADDLTGAADSAVHFRGAGRVRLTLPSAVPWPGFGPEIGPETGPENGTEFGGEDFVHVYDTETRNLDPGPAAEIVRSVCARVALHAGPRPPLFKKVDSTLRGNVAAEVLATAKVLGFAGVVLAPALPSQGRTVEDGRLLVGGVPVSRSAAGRDPHKPVTGETIAAILGCTVHTIGLGQVRGEGDFLEGWNHRLHRLVVVDGTEDGDLAAVAAALSTRPDLLPAGSAGLAQAIAARQGPALDEVPSPVAAVLVVVGSDNPAARAQVARLGRAGLPDVTILDVAEVAAGPPEGMVRALAARALPILAALPRPVAVLATGGATALALCEALAEDTIWIRGEVLPGLPWGTLEVSGSILVTKAGGFGGGETLVDTARLLLGGIAES